MARMAPLPLGRIPRSLRNERASTRPLSLPPARPHPLPDDKNPCRTGIRGGPGRHRVGAAKAREADCCRPLRAGCVWGGDRGSDSEALES